MTKRDAQKIKADMSKARVLIKDKEYDKARRILKSVEHPKAQEWLEKLDALSKKSDSNREKKSSKSQNLIRATAIAFVLVGSLLFVLILFNLPDDDASELTVEVTATPEPTVQQIFDFSSTLSEEDVQATESDVRGSLTIFRGVESIRVFDVTYTIDDEPMIYAEIQVSQGIDKTALANDILEYSTLLMGNIEFESVSMILDDGMAAVSYTLSTGENWDITTLDEFNADRVATRAAMPTGTPRPPSSSNSSISPEESMFQSEWICSGDRFDCSDFSSCLEVRNYFSMCGGDPSRLDEDNDGIPCESLCG